MTGNLHEAISYNKAAKEIADFYPDIAVKNIKVKAFPHLDIRIATMFNEALYKFWIWEIDEATTLFEEVMKFTEHSIAIPNHL